MNGPFKLTPAEVQSAVWQKIAKEIESRLVVLRQKNDGDLTQSETDRTRGEIKAIKNMLEWAKPMPTISNPDS